LWKQNHLISASEGAQVVLVRAEIRKAGGEFSEADDAAIRLAQPIGCFQEAQPVIQLGLIRSNSPAWLSGKQSGISFQQNDERGCKTAAVNGSMSQGMERRPLQKAAATKASRIGERLVKNIA
jgi:hypothetical protein